MIVLQEPYRSRPTRCLGIWDEAGWRLKVYGIAYQRAVPRPELLEAAKTTARQILPQPARDITRYGVGFLGVHDGRGGNFVFVDWWTEENELYHHVYVSPHDQPAKLRCVTRTGLVACVWDLRVLGFERQAWVETILANPNGPDVEAYLARQLNEDA